MKKTLAAGFSPAEKVELRKLWEAGNYIGLAYVEAAAAHLEDETVAELSPWVLHDVRSRLIVASEYLLHITAPTAADPTPPLPGRTEAIQQAFSTLEPIGGEVKRYLLDRLDVIQGTCANETCAARITRAKDYAAEAAARIGSFDRTLEYASPLLPIYPKQFGPHGDYTTSGRHLSEARRMLAYCIFQAGPSPAYGAEQRRYLGEQLMTLMGNVHRIMMLSAMVPVTPEDDQLMASERPEVAVPLKQISIAVSFFSSSVLSFAVRRTAQIGAHPLGNLTAAWVRIDSWTDSFTAIKAL